MKLPNDFFDHEDFEQLDEHQKHVIERRIVEDAFDNSYRVIMGKVTFDELMDDMVRGSLNSALLAHNPDETPKKETLENMIIHYSSADYEAYEKCGNLLKKLHEFYPETKGKLIEIY